MQGKAEKFESSKLETGFVLLSVIVGTDECSIEISIETMPSFCGAFQSASQRKEAARTAAI